MSSERLEGGTIVNQSSTYVDVPKSKKPWTYLSKFEVTCQGQDKVRCPVYSNGRQQVPIRILIQARDEDGVVVPVEDWQIELRLVDYDLPSTPPEGISWGRESPEFVYQWSVQRDTSGESQSSADALAGALGSPSDVDDKSVQVFSRWVTIARTAQVKLAARAISPEGVVFITNTPNPPPGKFDSYVIIEGREPVVISWDRFVMSEPRQVVNNNDWNVMLYYIYFADPSLRIVRSVNYRNNMGHPHFRTSQLPGKRVEQIAFRVTDKEDYNYRSCHSYDHYTTFPINDRPGQANAARVFDYRGATCANAIVQNGLMGYIDQYGTESKIGIRHSSPAYGEVMSLMDPNNADSMDEDGATIQHD